MIFSGSLSLSQQEKGQKNYKRFNLINGLSYMCLGETVIILFALQLNCQPYIIAALSAFLYLGNFAMPIGKATAARIGGAKSISLYWTLRNVSAMLVASAYFFRDMHAIAVSMIVVGTFIFYSCRSAGTVIMQPLCGEICTENVRGKFLA